MREEVENLERHRLANPTYFPSYVKMKDEQLMPALFTEREIMVAVERGKKNPEDIGEQTVEEKTWLESIFG